MHSIMERIITLQFVSKNYYAYGVKLVASSSPTVNLTFKVLVSTVSVLNKDNPTSKLAVPAGVIILSGNPNTTVSNPRGIENGIS